MRLLAVRDSYCIFFNKKIPLIALICFVIAMAAAWIKISLGPDHINNYLIFEGVFNHTLAQKNLYLPYPGEYFDKNLYGPFFSIIIAPFAIFPLSVGCLLWCAATLAIFIFAVYRLPFTISVRNIIMLICTPELIGSAQNVQSNHLLAAFIILAFVFTIEKNNLFATVFIAAGFLSKLYGLSALLFFFFAENKMKFAVCFLLWCLVMFCIPMLISSPDFIFQSYKDWFQALMVKNDLNTVSDMQNMSAMRVFDNIFGVKIPYAAYLGVAGVLFLVPLARARQWNYLRYQLLYLSLILITIVIFSSSAEGSTYIIAMSGVGIWYAAQCSKIKSWQFVILIVAVLFGSLSTTDLVPLSVKASYIRPYGVKAMPYIIVWLIAWYQLSFSSPSFFKNLLCAKQ